MLLCSASNGKKQAIWGRWTYLADLQCFLLRSNGVIDWQHPFHNRMPISSDQADLGT